MGLGRGGAKESGRGEASCGAAGSSPGVAGHGPRTLLPCPAEHKLLSAGPTEPWSIREKLCLASSVMRSGDQNWYGSGKGGRHVRSTGARPGAVTALPLFGAKTGCKRCARCTCAGILLPS